MEDIDNLLDDIQKNVAADVKKNKNVERLLVEDTPLRQLASKILESAKVCAICILIMFINTLIFTYFVLLSYTCRVKFFLNIKVYPKTSYLFHIFKVLYLKNKTGSYY